MAINQSASPRPRFADRLETLLQAIAGKLSSRPKGGIAAFGVFFAVAILVVFLADLRARYRAEINLAAHSARDHAEILAEYTALTFEAVDRALRQAQLIRAMGRDLLRSSEREAKPDAARLRQLRSDLSTPFRR